MHNVISERRHSDVADKKDNFESARTRRPSATMPTSSQAMILRCNDNSHRTMFNLRVSSPVEFRKDLNKPPDKDNVEKVHFDFSLSTTPEQSMKGYEGVFAFDPDSNAYKWQIYPVDAKDLGIQGKLGIAASGGDHGVCLEEQCLDKSGDQVLFIERETSEPTRHFTTPVPSLSDNREFTRPMESIDDETYRRLEGLGFRRRTPHMLGRCAFRLNPRTTSSYLPQKCMSEAQTSTEAVSALSIKNMDDGLVPEPKPLSYKKNRFSPTNLVSGESMRRRVATKQKSLLEEVKECVNWSRRVVPTSYPRPMSSHVRSNVVCFSLREGFAFSHQEIKELFENQIQCQVVNLQYDAISVRTGEPELLDRWIVGLGCYGDCEKAIERGLAVNGDQVIVRAWEDIVKEENWLNESGDAWLYPCSYRLQSEKHSRALKKFLKNSTNIDLSCNTQEP